MMNSINLIIRRFTSSEAQVRVRFAPSPTGPLHLGGLRTAFYNYVFARQNNGKFILRIEDTDQSRVVPGSAAEIEKILEWANLKVDESPNRGGNYGPYIQSQRMELYKCHVDRLIKDGFAYKCFCSPIRLELLKKYQTKNRIPIKYDGKCRNLSTAEIDAKAVETQNKYVIRFALDTGAVEFEDIVFGHLVTDFSESQESDPIIVKSDRYPTYHFANVVDDHTMDITHVLRGSEWLTSTAKHIRIYQAFGWTTPRFAHFPLIKMVDGTKMSKRHSQSQVKSWISQGYRPLAILNFLTNMGGGVPKEKQDSSEVWDLKTLVERFDFNHMARHPGSVDINRLRIYNNKELNQAWLADPHRMLNELKDLIIEQGLKFDSDCPGLVESMSPAFERATTLRDVVNGSTYIFTTPKLTWNPDEYADSSDILREMISLVQSIEDLSDKEKFLNDIKAIASKHVMDYP